MLQAPNVDKSYNDVKQIFYLSVDLSLQISDFKANIYVVRKMLKETYDFLMPNGMLIPLQVLTDTRLDTVKTRLFEEAKKYPAFELLGNVNQYVFGGVTLEAEIEEFREENVKLSDLPLYLPFLTVTMPTQQKQSLQMRHDLRKAMGISVDYLDNIKSTEIQDFRRDVGSMCEEVSLERKSLPEMKRLLFYYPPILDINPDLPMHVADIMKTKKFLIKVYIYNPGEEMEAYDVQIDASWTPSRVIHEIIFQKYTRRGEEKQMAEGRALRGEQLYVLKSCESEEYMFNECCLHSYKYIRHCITWDRIPALTLVFLDDLLHSIPEEENTPIDDDDPEMQSLSDMERLLISYPPVLDVNQDQPIDDIFKARRLITTVYLENPGEDVLMYNVEIDSSWTPRRVVKEIILQKYLQRGVEKALVEKRASKGEQLYVLKTFRREEYMLKDCCLHSYKYIRHCITLNITPELTLVLLCELLESIPRVFRRSSSQAPRNETGNERGISSWDIDGTLRIKVDNVTRQKAPPRTELRTMNVMAGIYHGSTLLCKTVSTAKYGWHQPMTIDIHLPDIPRAAKLCLSLCSSKKTVEYWVNIQLFDHKGRLVTGKQSLPMWPGTEATSLKHETVPLGITGCNPDGSFPTLEMDIISPSDKPIIFPSDEHILELIHEHKVRKISLTKNEIQTNMETVSVKDIDTMLGNDILVKIKKHDRDYLWKNREKCLEKPKSLPKLLTTLDWSKRTDVFELYKLLSMWPKKKVTQVTALQLLDARFPDPRIEKFAVDCLAIDITDEKLLLNLMQLTQALKFRSYIDGPLTRFLLKRSLLSRRAGKQLFWHLRSELHSSSIRLRFAPILELYCRNCGPFLQEHLKEVEVLNLSCRLAKEIKSRNEDPDMSVNFLREQLKNSDEANVLTNAPLIIGQPQQLEKICPGKCGVFKSKMQPLRLTWINPSPFANIVRAENFSYIFKHGDDIRQDMLYIQLLQIIDTIWKYEGLDCCLTPYGCLSMGHEIGMIEMVPNAETIATIHSEQGTLLSATGLNGWLHENNRDCYEKAVKSFTHSCAGYAVATFVLGISDRHFSDNIMVKRNGELFHIHFGHFLGKRTTKFGIKRERVPFVMIDDFIQVITKGVKKRDESENYRQFVLLCIKAYMALWKNADLLLTPLYLMRNSGLPELTKLEDIQFVRQALAVDKDEIKAASYFLDNLKKAIVGNWTIKVDWIFHAINQYIRS